MKDFEFRGVWWLPEHPETTVGGIIKFSPLNGSELKLTNQDFAPLIAQMKNREFPGFPVLNPHPENIDLVCGRLTDNREVTLYRCYDSGFSEHFFINYVMIGHCFKSVKEIIIDSIEYEYPNLVEWSNQGAWIQKEEEYNNGTATYQLKYEAPKPLQAIIGQWSITLNRGMTQHHSLKEIAFRQTASVKISCPQTVFDDYLEQNRLWENFLGLGMGKIVRPSQVSANPAVLKKTLDSGYEIYNKLSVYYKTGTFLLDSSDHLNFGYVLFFLEQISEDFNHYVSNWFIKAEKLKPVYDLYFGVQSATSMYLENQFLNIIQALETYHRRMYQGVYTSVEEYDHIYQLLVAALPPNMDKSHRQSLVGTLKYGNEYSLRKRLKLIFSKVLKDLEDITIDIAREKDNFIDIAVNTRNYLTHYTEDNNLSRAKTPKELYELVFDHRGI
jgi:hypothetical protein